MTKVSHTNITKNFDSNLTINELDLSFGTFGCFCSLAYSSLGKAMRKRDDLYTFFSSFTAKYVEKTHDHYICVNLDNKFEKYEEFVHIIDIYQENITFVTMLNFKDHMIIRIETTIPIVME